MTVSILGHLDRLADEHPDQLLYSFLDVNGDPIESYTYASFLQRTQAIAGHLLKEDRFAADDRLLLAYPPGLEMICAFFWLRARRIDPRTGLSPQFAWLPERPI